MAELFSALQNIPMVLTDATAGVTLVTMWATRKARRNTEPPATEAPEASPLHQKILEEWVSVRRSYDPYPFMTNPHVDTIFAALTRKSPNLSYTRELVEMPDGGCVALDWDPKERSEKLAADTPIIIFLPGLTSGSEDGYVQYSVRRARRQDPESLEADAAAAHAAAASGAPPPPPSGFRTVVFNSRGTSGSPVRTAQFYSASYTEDLRRVVRHVRELFPAAPLAAVGWSIGANILVCYLGEEGSDCPLSAAVSLCNPFDLLLSSMNLQRGFNKIYDMNLALALSKIFHQHAHLFDEAPAVDAEVLAAASLGSKLKAAAACSSTVGTDSETGEGISDTKAEAEIGDASHPPKTSEQRGATSESPREKNAKKTWLASWLPRRFRTISEFDQNVTIRSFGFSSAQAYYEASNSARMIPTVRVPLLCVQALNDPIAPAAAIPYASIRENKYCVFVGSKFGGHLGWTAGKGAPRGEPWSNEVSMEWLELALKYRHLPVYEN